MAKLNNCHHKPFVVRTKFNASKRQSKTVDFSLNTTHASSYANSSLSFPTPYRSSSRSILKKNTNKNKNSNRLNHIINQN